MIPMYTSTITYHHFHHPRREAPKPQSPEARLLSALPRRPGLHCKVSKPSSSSLATGWPRKSSHTTWGRSSPPWIPPWIPMGSRVDMGKIHEIKWRNYGETVGDRPGIWMVDCMKMGLFMGHGIIILWYRICWCWLMLADVLLWCFTCNGGTIWQYWIEFRYTRGCSNQLRVLETFGAGWPSYGI